MCDGHFVLGSRCLSMSERKYWSLRCLVQALIDRESPAPLTGTVAASWQSATLGVLGIEIRLSHVPLTAVLEWGVAWGGWEQSPWGAALSALHKESLVYSTRSGPGGTVRSPLAHCQVWCFPWGCSVAPVSFLVESCWGVRARLPVSTGGRCPRQHVQNQPSCFP